MATHVKIVVYAYVETDDPESAESTVLDMINEQMIGMQRDGATIIAHDMPETIAEQVE